MLVLQLVKKDVLIAKRFILIAMVVVTAIPLFVMFTAPVVPGFLSFLYMVVLGELLLLQAISQEEARCPKAVALLCAAPYTRSAFVKAKYIFFLMVFAYCTVVYTLLQLGMNQQANRLTVTEILAVLCVSVLIYSIYMPIEFQYGLVKAKFVFMAVILTFSLGPNLAVNLFSNITIDVSLVTAMSDTLKNIVLFVASAGIFGISMICSTSIFSKKEL